MLYLPEYNTPFRVAAIDPGTNTLGTAILDVDLYTGQVYLVDAQTFSGNRMFGTYQNMLSVHGERRTKLHAHEQVLLSWMQFYLPHVVICESPFLGRFPQAYEALVECKMAIRNAVMQYDLTLPLETVDPPSAKMAVGAPTKRPKGMSKDDFKLTVKTAIAKLPIVNISSRSLSSLDEHSSDAIAVGYFKCQQVLTFLGGK